MSYVDYGCDWFCDSCGALMNYQSGFTCENGTWICKECGYENDVTPNNILWVEDSSDDSAPEGCAACGGPYPMCKDSCPIFDE